MKKDNLDLIEWYEEVSNKIDFLDDELCKLKTYLDKKYYNETEPKNSVEKAFEESYEIFNEADELIKSVDIGNELNDNNVKILEKMLVDWIEKNNIVEKLENNYNTLKELYKMVLKNKLCETIYLRTFVKEKDVIVDWDEVVDIKMIVKSLEWKNNIFENVFFNDENLKKEMMCFFKKQKNDLTKVLSNKCVEFELHINDKLRPLGVGLNQIDKIKTVFYEYFFKVKNT